MEETKEEFLRSHAIRLVMEFPVRLPINDPIKTQEWYDWLKRIFTDPLYGVNFIREKGKWWDYLTEQDLQEWERLNQDSPNDNKTG